MTAQLDALRGKVQRILAERFGTIEVDKDGDFTIRNESARAFIRCIDWAEDQTLVSIFAPILFRVPPSPELFKYIATEGGHYFFGHIAAVETDDGIGIDFKHVLLGDYLDEAELTEAVVQLLITANQLDDEIQAKFGGSRFHEDG